MSDTPSSASSFKSFPIYDEIRKGMEDAAKSADIAKKVNGILCFKIKKADGKEAAWVIDLKSAKPTIRWTEDVKSATGDCVLTLADQDMMDLALGKLLPQKAFFSGQLKISGNMAMAMKVQNLLSMAGELKAKL